MNTPGQNDSTPSGRSIDAMHTISGRAALHEADVAASHTGVETRHTDSTFTNVERAHTGARAMPPAAAGTRRGDSEWRRLDRRMLLLQPVDAVKDFLPYILIALFAGAARNDGPWWSNLAIVIVPILIGVWAWATTTYRVTDEQLMLRRGIISRKTLTARLDRVRSVDVTASPLQRLLGVASVKIGTGSETPFSLDGLAAAEATALRADLLHVARELPAAGADGDPAQTPGGVPVEQPEEAIGAFSPAWIRYAPFSLTGLVTILAVVGFAAQFVDDIGDQVLDSVVGHVLTDYVTGLTLTMLVVQGAAATLLVMLVASLVTYVLRYWGYGLTRHPRGTLAVTRGLLTTRSTTIEERRLRGVELTRPFLLRLVGAARAEALVTGLTDDASSTSTSSDLLVPPAPQPEVLRIAGEVLRDDSPLQARLRQHGPAARRRRHVRALMTALIGSAVAIGLIVWLEADLWFYAVPALLILTAPLLAEARYGRLGHAFTGDHLVSRVGVFPERTTVVLTSAIIGWNITETIFQRRVGLVTLVATIAAGDDAVAIPDLTLAEAEAVVRAATPGLGEAFMLRRP